MRRAHLAGHPRRRGYGRPGGHRGKGGEAAAARRLIGTAAVAGSVVTFDALHTAAATARAVIDGEAWRLFCVKGNSPTHPVGERRGPAHRLNDDYTAAGRFHEHVSRGHAASSTARSAVPERVGLGLPAQVFRILRRSKDLDTEDGWPRKETAWSATALPEAIAGLADLAAYARGHWSVDNKIHYVRDVTFGEDHSNTHIGNAPENLATCRNLVIGTLRAVGNRNIAHARSLQASRHDRVLTPFDP